MSETIEKRYEYIKRRWLRPFPGDYADDKERKKELRDFLSDLMAEWSMGIPVDLDELFEPEVLEKAAWWGFRNEDGDVDELLDTPQSAIEFFLANEWEHGFFSDEPCEMTLVALSDEDVETDFGTMKKIIGETLVRLSLIIQKVED